MRLAVSGGVDTTDLEHTTSLKKLLDPLAWAQLNELGSKATQYGLGAHEHAIISEVTYAVQFPTSGRSWSSGCALMHTQ